MQIEQVQQMMDRRQELHWVQIPQTQEEIERTYGEFLEQEVSERITYAQRLQGLRELLPLVRQVSERYRLPMLTAAYVEQTYLDPVEQRAYNFLNGNEADFITAFDVVAGMALPLGSFRLAPGLASNTFNPEFRRFIAETPAAEGDIPAVYAQGTALAREIIGFLNQHQLGREVFQSYQKMIEAGEETPGLLDAYSKVAVLAGVNLSRRLYFGTIPDTQRIIRRS